MRCRPRRRRAIVRERGPDPHERTSRTTTRTNMLNTRTINYLELIGNGKVYRVPQYQRNYSWTREQWEDLWIDIDRLRGKADDRHHLGALVVEAKSDREFLVIDGQQRLATLSLLALAIIAKLDELANEGHEPEANREILPRAPRRLAGRCRQRRARPCGDPVRDGGSRLAVHPDHRGRRPERVHGLRNAERPRTGVDDYRSAEELSVLESAREWRSRHAATALVATDRHS